MATRKKPLTAQDMGRLRWKGKSKKERSEHARRMNDVRWARKGRKAGTK